MSDVSEHMQAGNVGVRAAVRQSLAAVAATRRRAAYAAALRCIPGFVVSAASAPALASMAPEPRNRILQQ
ncbi:MAG TPA: hypothetical protein DDZ67_11150 [Xanthomonadaceae bacterium]|nr:hypothetical protein [Xanthomonadaceae bacterium]